MNIRITIAATVLLLVIGTASARAQQPQRDDSPFGRYLFPPELVMQRQQQIGLTESQRNTLSAEMQKAQATFTNLQWKIAGESEKLEKLLQAPNVEEERVLGLVDAILGIEREIKRTQITLLVRIRNNLTDAQRTKLMELREQPIR